MPRRKPKRNTTYRHRYNALSALEVHTIGKIQRLWTLLVMQLKVAEQLFAFSLMLELDGDEEFLMLMMLHVHHCMHTVEFLSLLDNHLMEITPDQVIPRLLICFILGGAMRRLGFVLLSSGSCIICWSSLRCTR